MESKESYSNGPNMAEPMRPSADQMDEYRYQQMAHEYLCRLREAREWIQTCLEDKLPELIEFEEALRNGVILARLGHFVAPKVVRMKDIFDLDQSHYQELGLHFRHTDNVSRFLRMADLIGLPKVFYPEIVDIYDKKNMPKAVYCVHALSLYLHKRFGNKFPTLTDVSNTARFTEEEISAMAKELARYGVTIPAFGKIGGLLANEMPIDQVALHAAIIVINQTIETNDVNATLLALQNPNAHLVNVRPENGAQYQNHLLAAKAAKRASADLDESVEYSVEATELYSHFLTREEIQECIDSTNDTVLMNEVNDALAAGESIRLLKLLRHPVFELSAVLNDHPEYYLRLLQQAAAENGAENSTRLTKDQIRELILRGHAPLQQAIHKAALTARINDLVESNADNHHVLAALHELDKVEQIGPLVDSAGDLYVKYLAEAQQAKSSDAAGGSDWFVAATAHESTVYANAKTGEIRLVPPEDDDAENSKYLDASEIGEVIRQSHKERDDEERKHEEEAASKIQRDEAARRIQSFYRKQKPQHDYQALMNSQNPSLYLVQKFANLLNETDIDYEEELEIERLRKAIREEIRQHKKYEKQLDELDLQIGLLVRNRINLEKTPKLEERGRRQSGSMKRASMTELNGENRGFGFDLLSKPGRQRLHAYQNLLYFLTRNPKYLSSLLVSESASGADQFTESVILPLFNHGTGSYDEYLLLRFFKTAMEMEMDRKVGNISELQAVNLVSIDQLIKFIVSTHGDQYKREALQQLLNNLLSITDSMETDPVEVYQRWIADLESRTGRSSDLPLDLTAEQALVHPEVKEKIHESVVALKRWVADFLDAILGNVGKLPYCLRYFCKALRSKLIAKFPHEKLGTVSKAAADNLFHRFIQACVALQNRMVNEDDERSKRQRQATANVAKLLRYVMVNKGYNQEHPHLMEFNIFIKECHQRFKNFFNSLCDVPELEEYFQVDEYVDYVMPTKPSVIMQLGDLIKLHQLLVDHRTAIARDISDPLHELLNDLGGGRPSISDIVGDVDEGTRKRAESADLVLNLTDKFEVPSDAKDGIRYEFLRTKKYLIDIILVQRAPSVVELLTLPVSAEEEKKHNKILDNRRQRDQEIEGRLTLVEKKAAVLVGLSTLEEAGLVSRSNDYRDIIAAIAQDIRTRSLYRENRARERARLLAILEKLKQKSASYREQIEFYDLYLKACLNSMPTQAKKRDSLKRGSGEKQVPTVVKYSASELVDKGVLLSFDKQSSSDLRKSVHFEIKNTSDPGVFEISTKSMGAVDFQVEEIVLQKLLQLQFENVPVTTFFGKVKMNVTPLIALLNKKFFAKGK